MHRSSKRWDNPAVALGLLLSLVAALFGLAGPARLHAASQLVASWSAVSLGTDAPGVKTFPDTTAASTGFTSIPTARALIMAPRWRETAAAPTPAPKERLAAAIVGLPVDVDHDMLRGVGVQSYCITPRSAAPGTLSLCQQPKQLYGDFVASGKFNLCDFNDDCWHSTAVAIVASGNPLQQNVFAMPQQQANADFKTTTLRRVVKTDYDDYAESASDMGQRTSFRSFLAERYRGFEAVLDVVMPIASLTYGGSVNQKTYITPKMLVDRGVRPGGPLLAVNVFSRFESAVQCDGHDGPPCVLTTLGAQEAALQTILDAVIAGRPLGATDGKPGAPLGAIVIVAGGPLTAGRCDDSNTAKLIAELRRRRVLTFVPVGNDGNPDKVRFPACASAAIAVGSTTRDGAAAPFSNGNRAKRVALYVDGETVVLPIRGPRLLHTLLGGRASDCKDTPDDGDACEVRPAENQYDAYLAGGTLLSAAVASSVYLNLRERFPDATPEAVLTALQANRTAAASPVAEANEQAAGRLLAGTGAQ